VKDSQFLKERLLWSFRRSTGGKARLTVSFDELPEEPRSLLARCIALGPDELGVVVFFQTDYLWSFVTTDRVAWTTNGELFVYAHDQLKQATVDRDEITRSGGQAKEYMNKIVVITKKGTRHEMPAEAGTGLAGLLGVLRWLIPK
jgi:hypothetical protein